MGRIGAVMACVAALVAAAVGDAAADAACEYPNVVIVVDRSGSMTAPLDDTVDGKSMFEVARDTIDAVLRVYEGSIRFGLCLFPWGTECEKGLILVTPADKTTDKVIAAMNRDDAQPDGATPIGDTLNALSKEPFLHETGRRTFVLFITDGGETCEGDPVGATQALFASGVGVFVVGFGSGVDAETLASMARAGGYPRQEMPSYYQADNDLGLYDALNSVLFSATTEICDGLDNDCNGVVDDGIEVKRCAGPCGLKGQKICRDGATTECIRETGEAFTDEDRAACAEEEDPGSCSCSVLRF